MPRKRRAAAGAGAGRWWARGWWRWCSRGCGIARRGCPGGGAAGPRGRAAGLESLTWGVGMSPMLLAIGMMTGLPMALSMLLGAGLAWGVLGPGLVDTGRWRPRGGYEKFAAWLMWPGVGLMVGAAVVSLAAQAAGFRARRRTCARWARPGRAAPVGLGVGSVACVLALVLGGGVRAAHARCCWRWRCWCRCARCGARGAGQTDVSRWARWEPHAGRLRHGASRGSGAQRGGGLGGGGRGGADGRDRCHRLRQRP